MAILKENGGCPLCRAKGGSVDDINILKDRIRAKLLSEYLDKFAKLSRIPDHKFVELVNLPCPNCTGICWTFICDDQKERV